MNRPLQNRTVDCYIIRGSLLFFIQLLTPDGLSRYVLIKLLYLGRGVLEIGNNLVDAIMCFLLPNASLLLIGASQMAKHNSTSGVVAYRV